MISIQYEENIVFQDWPVDAQSRDIGSPVFEGEDVGGGASGTQVVIQDVPVYLGYRGCGPTAAAMIIGYYDGHGYPDLVSGDASTQTTAVNNMISSQGNWDDYCVPLDYYPGPMYNDKSEYPWGDEHDDDCIADFMKTSQSYYNNYYSWSWFSDVDDALEDYVDYIAPQYEVDASNLKYIWGGLNWDNYCAEINANRPMVLLIDSDGDDDADHYVTGVGYWDDNGQKYYGCYDTWTSSLRWYDFSEMGYGNNQGIYGATFCEFTQIGAQLAYSPSFYDFGTLNKGVIDFTAFEIWNSGPESLTYSLSESCNWVEVVPTSGVSTGKHNQIVVSIDTTGLSDGNHNCNININSNGGSGIFTISVYVLSDSQQTDQEQTQYDSKYAAYSNNWIAQSFKPSKDLLTRIELYVSKKGSPPSDLVVSIRNSLTGSDLTSVSRSSSSISSNINWIEFDFIDISVTPGSTYYIIMRTSGGNNFDAYEWGFGYYDPYSQGVFLKSSNSGSSWTQYSYYDFCFKTYGNSGNGYPPNTPSIPSGPTSLLTGSTGTYSTTANDPDWDDVQYRFYWGEGTFSSWTSLVNSGQSASKSNYWDGSGTYVVKAQARDENGMISGWSNGLSVVVSGSENNNPNAPSIPAGPSNLNTGQTGTYTTSGTDPDNDQVQYRFDWDDGQISTWTNLVPSGTTANKDHQWTTPGTYQIKAQTRDEHLATSTWSNTKTDVISEIPNNNPNAPSTPSGPISMDEGQTGTYTTSGTDPDNDQVQYRFDWDADGTHEYSSWTTLGPSGHTDSLDHQWNTAGTYTVKAQTRDEHLAESTWSPGLTVTITETTNNNPNTPNTPTGPSNLNTGQTGTYTTSGTDPDNDQVQYRFDWDDGQISTWTNLVPSGTTASKDHQWTTPGTYQIKAQTRDEHLATSTWSNTKTITINIPTEQLDQQQTTQNNDYSTYSNNWIAQSFKPTLGTLTRVDLYIGKDGSPPTDLVVSIRSSITGVDLTTISKSSFEISYSLNWIEFDFDDISVTPEETYYIILRTSGGNNFNSYNWGFGYYDPYSRGAFWKSSSSGASWTQYSYYDFCFKTYGEPAGPPEPILAYSPPSYDFGNLLEGTTTQTTFQIWNSGTGTLTYTITETATWITSITPNTGTSTGEQDTITINIDTTELTTGTYNHDISINTNGGNNIFTVTVTVIPPAPILSYNPTSHDFGDKIEGITTQTTFQIWNSGTGTLTYTITETATWITSITPNTGTSTGEQDTITINIDTTGLTTGTYNHDISINTNGGNNQFPITVNIIIPTEQLDQQQTKQDNDYSTYSNNWIAQSFKPTLGTLTKIELLINKKGNPTTDLILSIRSTNTGPDLTTITKTPSEIPTTLTWIEFNLNDISITPESTYYIVMRTDGGNNFNAYEWGFGYYNPYSRGSFWRSLNFGSSWTEFTYYDFCFKTFGK